MKVIRTAAMVTSLLIGTGTAAPSAAQDVPPADSGIVSCPIVYSAEARVLGNIVGVRECWPTNVSDGDQLYLSDLYTRWVVEEIDMDPNVSFVRDYRAERHSPLERIFLGRNREATVTVKIQMHDPDVAFTIPLLSADYDGRRGKGQSFTTLLNRSDMSLPAFRITPRTSANIETKARSSNQIDMQATGIVLTALKDTLAVASPASSLLTSINRDQVQRTASAFDTAVSQLLSSTKGETTTTSRLLSEWRPGYSFLISVVVPDSIRTTNQSGDPRRIWFRITMECPRISAFDTLNVCELKENNVFTLVESPHGDADVGQPGVASSLYRRAIDRLRNRISPHQILSFSLGPNKTVRQFLTEQEWFISLSKEVLTAPAAVNRQAAAAATSPATSEGTPTGGGAGAAADGAATDGAADTPSPSSERTPPPAPDKTGNEVTDNTRKANELCEAITEKLYSAGLSRLDANIGLWAAITGMPDFTNSRGIFQNAPSCREHLPRDTVAWRFETAPARAPKVTKPRPRSRR
jgi:hypothetical protein